MSFLSVNLCQFKYMVYLLFWSNVICKVQTAISIGLFAVCENNYTIDFNYHGI